MRTLNFKSKLPRSLAPPVCCILIACTSALRLQAQEEFPPDEPEAAAIVRPEATDSASQQLIRNYLTVTGGAAIHERTKNIAAKGSLEEAGKIKAFELIERQDGKRHLTLTWRHLGRNYKEYHVFDGLSTWKQAVSPELKDAEDYSGQEGIHFSHQRWLLQPFVLPSLASYVFKYQGGSKISGRSCHVVVGYGKNNERSWFYFDKENFLLLRWGGFGEVAGAPGYRDYRATKFRKVDGLLLPSEIDLLVEDAAYGKIQIDSILLNQEHEMGRFNKPRSRIPVLRQRSS